MRFMPGGHLLYILWFLRAPNICGRHNLFWITWLFAWNSSVHNAEYQCLLAWLGGPISNEATSSRYFAFQIFPGQPTMPALGSHQASGVPHCWHPPLQGGCALVRARLTLDALSLSRSFSPSFPPSCRARGAGWGQGRTLRSLLRFVPLSGG